MENVWKQKKKLYYLFNKPKGVITTAMMTRAVKRSWIILRKSRSGIYPVGRLDQNTEGLLLMTNDGELANILMHPSKLVDKTYEVKIKGHIADTVLQQLADGVELEDGMTAPAIVCYNGYDNHTGITNVEITIHEGRNRRYAVCLNILALSA